MSNQLETVLNYSGMQNPTQSCKGSGVFVDRLGLSILWFLILRIVLRIHSFFVVSESQNLPEQIGFEKYWALYVLSSN